MNKNDFVVSSGDSDLVIAISAAQIKKLVNVVKGKCKQRVVPGKKGYIYIYIYGDGCCPAAGLVLFTHFFNFEQTCQM